MNHHAYIGLGSNLGDSLATVQQAVEKIHHHANITVIACSPWYRSKAVGPGEQEDYVNGAIQIETSLSAHALLDTLQSIELQHGRERKIRWGARTLDLDILLFNSDCIQDTRLQIPHPRIDERNFVVKPLLDLTPDLSLPNGRHLAEILHIIGTDNLQQIERRSTP